MTTQVASQPVSAVVQEQRHFFNTGQTRNVQARIEQLQTLRRVTLESEAAITKALQADLHKSEFEAYGEIGVFLEELTTVLKHLKSWVKPRRVASSWVQFPSSAQIYPEPLGVVLIIGPWNYPFQLVLSPLVGAIAAGNCAILKPSELAPQTSAVVADLIQKHFDPQWITVVEGGVETSQALLAEKFDHIFFTGGTAIGKVVMAAAAQHLTPVTLELGGKSPCIVDADVHLDHAARRIVWGKLVNAGQTCIAPDYLLVDRRIKADLLQRIQACITEFYGTDPGESSDYGRIINDRHFERLCGLLGEGTLITGGETRSRDRYIAPTLIDGVSLDAKVMQEEIFGPILPVLEYSDPSEAIAIINQQPKPLALYVFSRDRALQERVLRETSSGGVCINDVIMHVAVNQLPFGGVGDSGMGSYHGKASFDTFSHYKSVLKRGLWLDLKWRYAPYGNKVQLLKKLFK